MVVETYRTSGGSGCEVIMREEVGGAEAAWRFSLKNPADLVLAFLNDEYDALRSDGSRISGEQALYYREVFSRGNGPLLRDMVDHVLVCGEERGFDTIARLAAYSFANEMFDLSRVASYTERLSLETSVLGKTATGYMSESWNALLAEHKKQQYPRREDLFEALVQDAQKRGYPFELGLSSQYSSLPQLLKAFVAEMIRGRVLLRRCAVCGRYGLAKEEAVCICAGDLRVSGG